jgi:hypothetical protein
MAGIDFDRQAFTQAQEPGAPLQTPRLVGGLFVIMAVLVAGYAGFRLVSKYVPGEPSAEAAPPALEQIQQQLADMEVRLDLLEKHRKAVTVIEAQPARPVAPAPAQAVASAPKRSSYKIEAASALPAQRVRPQIQTAPQAGQSSPSNAGATVDLSATREAWQATTDRLADVVGVVGSQQGQLSQAREDLNALLAEARRTAVPFELRRGASREPVGPLWLLLKGSDPKTQRYTLCIYVDGQCVEIKDRAADEVVVIVLSRGSAPLELVATKVLKDQIVGYLEVPTDKAIR